MTILCRRYNYHLRLERVEEMFKRTDSELGQRIESSKTVRCKDCGKEITTSNISEIRFEPAPAEKTET